MENLQVFNNTEFGNLTTIEIDNKVWFLGKEVAEILGYNRPQKAVNDHVDYNDKKRLSFKACPDSELATLWSGNDFSDKTLINESGLYSLIFSSKLQSAKKFKRWVTDEVLPNIRKTGAYIAPETLEEMISNPDFAIGLLEELKVQKEKNAFLEEENKELDSENSMLIIKNEFLETDRKMNEPKLSYHDNVLNSEELVSPTLIAKDYGKSASWLNNKLHKLGIIYKRSGQWVLYDKYAEEGYAHSKTTIVGNGLTTMHTYWTQKGRQFIYDVLKDNNILPLLERENSNEKN